MDVIQNDTDRVDSGVLCAAIVDVVALTGEMDEAMLDASCLPRA